MCIRDRCRDGGRNIASIIREIVACIEDRLGDSSIFYSALLQKDLGILNMNTYDYLRFKAKRLFRYECCQSSFPSLRRSQISSSISKVSYSLNTADLGEFLVEEVEFERS